MRIFSGFSKTEKRILIASFILMLICLFLFTDESLFLQFTGKPKATGAIIGTIETMDRDVRFKGDRRFDWGPASHGQPISGGDAVYSGSGSKAIVTLNNGNKIEVGEKSLVRFVKVNGEQMTDLSLGTFKLKVDGSVNVAINGEVTRLEGKNSEVEVRVEKTGKPKVKLVRGEAFVEKKRITRTEAPAPVPTPQQVVKIEVPAGPPVVAEDLASTYYTWRLYDLYEKVDGVFKRRERVPSVLKSSREISWVDATQSTYKVEHSNDSEFQSGVQIFSANAHSLRLLETNKGFNFWRVSRDGVNWSKTGKFKVETGLSPYRATFEKNQINVTIGETILDYDLKWTAPENTKPAGYVLEASAEPRFPRESTIARYLTQPAMKIHATFPQTIYYRVITVSPAMELSQPSETVALVIEPPPRLGSPRLPLAKLDLKRQLDATVSWEGLDRATSYRVEIIDDAGRTIALKETKGKDLGVAELKNGNYRYRVSAVDKWGRQGATSKLKTFGLGDVEKIVAKVEPPKFAKEFSEDPPMEQKRLPSSFDMSNVGKIDPIPPTTNARYSDSAIQIEGASFTMMSSKQKRDDESPFLASLAIRGWKWWGSNGAEGYLKTKAAAINQAGSGVSPIDFEIRAHRRARFRWDWFDFIRELQVTAFVGLETYQSSTSGGKFSPGYQLGKIGSLISFPFGRRWSSGGEVIYGYGVDGSNKLELSGNAFYYFEKNWSIGGGYRGHFFEAGSKATSPSTVPYREGYVEAFSTLRYNY